MKFWSTHIGLFLAIFVSLSGLGYGQDGKFQSVITDEHLEPIGGVLIRNLNAQKSAISDAGGFFSIEAAEGDSLIIMAMGYEVQKIHPSQLEVPYIRMKPILFPLREVTVYEFKSWEGFKRDFLELEIDEPKVNSSIATHADPRTRPTHLQAHGFESRPGLVGFVVSPISSLAYYFNDEEKEKRKVWHMMNVEKSEELYWSLMRADSIQSWLEVPDSLIYPFIFYCNKNIADKKQRLSYYYQEKIGELYPLFLEERKK